MGCINSKRAVSVVAASPVSDYSAAPPNVAFIDHTSVSSKNPSGSLDFEQKHRKDKRDSNKHRKDGSKHDKNEEEIYEDQKSNLQINRRVKRGSSSGSIGFKLGPSSRHVGVEQIAAGWPSWLSAAAGEAIHGWVPLRADAFEKLDKIGQGTYSSVFQAREVETRRMVALKKVRFDNFQPESIRFMAREIMILRRLDHPNIVKLEGIITSRLSSSIYLVFEYMEHDLAGLSSSPDIMFSESQVKCYMKQLLHAIEHCHLRGIIHRDIKSSNILVNNEGILKLGDFGLANILSSRNRQQLTSRVVTLWYRPPELLMGSTSYGVSVDLWSVGCVFAELLLGKPLLKGRTEVEQLHKIFKLCGSPPDEYWKQARLPNTTMFRPQHPYESSLRERCKDFSTTAVDLIETFLSIEPEKRGTASSALISEYFNTTPYACDPSSLPKYPPNKELDAKYRDEARRKKAGGRIRDPVTSRKPRRVHKTLQEQSSFNRFLPKEEEKNITHFVRKTNDGNAHASKGGKEGERRESPLVDTISEASQVTKGDYGFTGPALTASSGFAWAKKRREDTTSAVSYDPSISSSQISELDSSRFNFANGSFDLTKQENDKLDSHEATAKHEEAVAPSNNLNYSNQREKVEFSGPLLSQSSSIDAILQRNESQIRRAARRSRTMMQGF